MDMQHFQSVFAHARQSELPRVGTIPGRPDLKGVPYFEYGSYFLGSEFKKLCPSAVPIGIGWLASWTWHINTEGLPNIRPVSKKFQDIWNGPVISPWTQSPELRNKYLGTYGIIYVITPDEVETLNRNLGDRTQLIQHVQCVATKVSKPHLDKKTMNVIMHFDSRNTADAFTNIWKNNEEQERWRQGLGMLKLFSIPDPYLQKIKSKLSGSTVNADQEPITKPTPIFHKRRTPKSSPSQMLIQISNNQHPLISKEQQIIRHRLHILKDQHQTRRQSFRRQTDSNGNQAPRSPTSNSPLVPNKIVSHLTHKQQYGSSISSPQIKGHRYQPSTRELQNLVSISRDTFSTKSLAAPLEDRICLPIDELGIKFVILTEKDRRSSLQDIIQNVDYPAMKKHPMRVSMFPKSNKKSEEEEINYLVDCLRDTLKLPGTTYLKTVLPDGTPIAMIGFSVWDSKKDPKSGALNIVSKQENKSYRCPSTSTPIEVEELYTKLSDERVKGFKAALQASKTATKIMSLETLVVAPKYQNKGIGFNLMQWYCQEMLKHKLGSFLLAPAEVCDMFTQFHFNPGRKIHIAKGTLTCMYRAYNSSLPAVQPKATQDHWPIQTSEKNYRADGRLPKKIYDESFSAESINISTVQAPIILADMPPPPIPSKQPFGQQLAYSTMMGPLPKPTGTSKRQCTTKKAPPANVVKCKDRHEPSYNDTFKEPRAKIRKVAALRGTSSEDFELVVEKNGRGADFGEKGIVVSRQFIREQSAEPQIDTINHEWGLVVENGRAVVKRQPSQEESRQNTQYGALRAVDSSIQQSAVPNGSVSGPSMHMFNPPSGTPGYPSKFLHNQHLSQSTSRPTKSPQASPAPLLPNSGARAHGRPDLPEVTVGPRLYASGIKQQCRSSESVHSNGMSAIQNSDPTVQGSSFSSRFIENQRIYKPVDTPTNMKVAPIIANQQDTVQTPCINNQTIEEQGAKFLTENPVNVAVAASSVGHQHIILAPYLSNQAPEEQMDNKSHREPVELSSIPSRQHYPGYSPYIRGQVITNEREHTAFATSAPSLGINQSYNRPRIPFQNDTELGGQQYSVAANPSYSSIDERNASAQLPVPVQEYPRSIVGQKLREQQGLVNNFVLPYSAQTLGNQQQDITQSHHEKAHGYCGGQYPPNPSSVSQKPVLGRCGQYYSRQDQAYPAMSFNGLQHYNHVTVPSMNLQGQAGGQYTLDHTHPAISKDHFSRQAIQNPISILPNGSPSKSNQDNQGSSHAPESSLRGLVHSIQSNTGAPPSTIPQITAQNLQDARKRNPNLVNLPDNVVREILSKHIGKMGGGNEPLSGSASTPVQNVQQFQLPPFPPNIPMEQIRFAIQGYRLGYPYLASLRDDQIAVLILQHMKKINADQIKVFRENSQDLSHQTDEYVRFGIVHRMSGFSPEQVKDVRQLDPNLINNDDYQVRLHIVQNLLTITAEEVQVARQRNPHLARHTNGTIRYNIFKHGILSQPKKPQVMQEDAKLSSIPQNSPQAPAYSPISSSWTPLKRKTADAGNAESPSKKVKM